MKYELFDYQRAAAEGCLERLQWGRDDAARGRLGSFALSALTGSGKTVIATAVIEAILHGSADFGVDADPRAAFLWVTDDPALNKQTRNKMLQASDLLAPARLIELDNSYLDPTLRAGRVYFLNIQKLAETAGLARGGVNLRQFSMWDIIRNTVEGDLVDLYLVLDEAHRGMKRTQGRKTIVQRIISGQSGSNPPVPVVWGISATVDRFRTAMKGIENRTEYPPVEVDIDQIRASGLVKDEIGLDEPDESGTFGTTLLREAVVSLRDYEQRWAAYSQEQNEPQVLPVMVVQVPDKATPDKLAEIVSTIESEWSGLGPDAIAHVFGEHEPLHLGARTVRWVPPESIQGDDDIRIVLAKEAISTGWDCPRAEVMYSERPATDATHIAQVIGRMVRQPLAHRIATDDALNTVQCFLPHFNRQALGVVKSHLEGTGSQNGDEKVGPDVVRAPKVFERNPHVPDDVFDTIEGLPSIPTPNVLVSPLRRARNLARLLTDTANGPALVPDAGEELTRALNNRLDGLATEHADQVQANVDDLWTTDIRRHVLDPSGNELAPEARQVITHTADLDRDTLKVVRSLREGVGLGYLKHRVSHDTAQGTDRLNTRVAVAALLMIPEVVESVEDRADKWAKDKLAEHAVAISHTTGATRDSYRRVQEQTPNLEVQTISLRDNISTGTCDKDGNPLPTFPGHIYSDADGQFPAVLNTWETEVVQTETGRSSFVAWYRNPSRSTPAALRVAYENDAGKWTSVQPDFVVVGRRDDDTLAVSIVDPHGDHLADARNKLQALARYAAAHADQFVRIWSISKTGDGLRYLDLKDAPTRDTVLAFEGAEVAALYESEHARTYQ